MRVRPGAARPPGCGRMRRPPSPGAPMDPERRLLALRIVLVVVGLTSLAVQPLMMFWPSGWAWHSGHSDYPAMIVGLYMTLGVFLLRAVGDPAAHRTLISFAAGSTLV